MEVRERHTPSRAASAAEGDHIPGTMSGSPKSGVFSTRGSATPIGRSVPVSPRVREARQQHEGMWEGEFESEEVASDIGYGSKETLSKGDMLRQEPWTFPVRPVFPSDEDSDEEDEDMAVMTTCCCCFSTKNGTIGVGIISLVVAFCLSVAFCFALINVDDLIFILQTKYDDLQVLKQSNNETADYFFLLDKIIGFDNFVSNLQTILIVFLVFYAIYTFSCLFLTYGSCTSIRSLLVPWIVLEFGPFGIQLAGIIIMFVYGKDDPVLAAGGTYIIAGLLQIVAFVIHVYWWMCPVAHYQTLKEETEVQPLVTHDQLMYPNRGPKY